MTEVLVRVKGVPETVLDELISQGYYATKADAVRAGIIELGKELNLIGSPAYYREKFEKEVKKTGVKMSPKQAAKALSELEA